MLCHPRLFHLKLQTPEKSQILSAIEAAHKLFWMLFRHEIQSTLTP